MADSGSTAPRILIAASGTGGHLMPALFIAQALKKIRPEAQVEFLGAGRPLEAKIIDPKGFARSEISIVGIKSRGIFGAAQFLLKLPAAFLKTWKIFDRFRPTVVIGVGGYVSFLPVLIAFLRGVPRWIHEAERRPGLANFVLTFIASKVSVAFEDAWIPLPGKKVLTGQPVREEIISFGAEDHNPEVLRHLLVLGGSQGARSLDETLPQLSDLLARSGLEVLHQCRPENVAAVARAYAAGGVSARVVDFIDDTPGAYRWSDIVVARSGAGTVMELGVVNRPAVLVPYPHAQAGHQLVNAKLLETAGKALIIEEGPEFAERLRGALEKVLSLSEFRRMKAKPLVNRSVSAASSIASGALALSIMALSVLLGVFCLVPASGFAGSALADESGSSASLSSSSAEPVSPYEFYHFALENLKPVPGSQPQPETVRFEQAFAWKNAQGAVLVDLRSAEDYARRHLKGAVSIPLESLTEARAASVIGDKSRRVVIYCENNLGPSRRIALTTMGYPILKSFGYSQTFLLEDLYLRKDLDAKLAVEHLDDGRDQSRDAELGANPPVLGTFEVWDSAPAESPKPASKE